MSKAREFIKKYVKKGYETMGCNDCSGKGIVHYTCNRCKGEGKVIDFCRFELVNPDFRHSQCMLKHRHKGNHKFSKEFS